MRVHIEGSGFLGKELRAIGEVIEDFSERAIHEVLEEGEEAGILTWSSSCLTKFSRALEC